MNVTEKHINKNWKIDFIRNKVYFKGMKLLLVMSISKKLT